MVLTDRIVARQRRRQRPAPALHAVGSGDPITGPAWSPDGNKLAFAYQDKINVLDLTARSVTSLTTPGRGQPRRRPGVARGRHGSGSGVSGRRLGSRARARHTRRHGLSRRARLDLGPSAFACAPPTSTCTPTGSATLLLWPGIDLDLVVGARPHAGVVARDGNASSPTSTPAASEAAGLPLSATSRRHGRRTTRRRPPGGARRAGRRTASALAFVRDGQVLHGAGARGRHARCRAGHRPARPPSTGSRARRRPRSVAGPCSRRRAARRPRR